MNENKKSADILSLGPNELEPVTGGVKLPESGDNSLSDLCCSISDSQSSDIAVTDPSAGLPVLPDANSRTPRSGLLCAGGGEKRRKFEP